MQAAPPPDAVHRGAASESPSHSLANDHEKEVAVSAGAVASGNGASGPPPQADIKRDAEVPVAAGGRAREVAVKQEALSTNGESVSAHTCRRCVRCTRRAALLCSVCSYSARSRCGVRARIVVFLVISAALMRSLCDRRHPPTRWFVAFWFAFQSLFGCRRRTPGRFWMASARGSICGQSPSTRTDM